MSDEDEYPMDSYSYGPALYAMLEELYNEASGAYELQQGCWPELSEILNRTRILLYETEVVD